MRGITTHLFDPDVMTNRSLVRCHCAARLLNSSWAAHQCRFLITLAIWFIRHLSLYTTLCNLHCSQAPPPRFAVDTNMRYDAANEVTRKRRMPSVLRVGRFRFYFFSNEQQEPPHIHVK